jgi:hypothetical protein
MKLLITFGLFICASALVGQVEVVGGILLTGDTSTIRGLSMDAPPDGLLPMGVERGGQHRVLQATGGNAWSAPMPNLPGGPVPGTALLVQPPGAGNGPISLAINDGASYAVMRSQVDTLYAEDIPAGHILYLVHDGTRYWVMNGIQDIELTCPTGMVALNARVCVEVQERPVSFFENAAITCVNAGSRLCSWGDLVAACTRRTSLGLVAMTNDLEWTASTANEDGSARVALGSTCQQIGAANTATTTYTFRCCSNR